MWGALVPVCLPAVHCVQYVRRIVVSKPEGRGLYGEQAARV